ncbi:MAG TPA: hypothetical protein PLL19_07205, partial [Thiobacillaceae bacterium]|nr:hypothetical protein [Thiobacillaceae bacterium]
MDLVTKVAMIEVVGLIPVDLPKRLAAKSTYTAQPTPLPLDLTDRSIMIHPMQPDTDTRSRILAVAREMFHGR